MNIQNTLALPTNYTYRTDILNPLTNLFNGYVDEHSKTLVVRFDLHYPATYPMVTNNACLSELIAYITKKYQRWGLSPKYFWVMEQAHSHNPHYHVVLFLDGQKVRSYSHVFHAVEDAWSRALGVDVSGCIHHCNSYNGAIDMNRNGLQIRRCDGEELFHTQQQAVYNQISYLAKEDTKAERNDGLRNFGMSRFVT